LPDGFTASTGASAIAGEIVTDYAAHTKYLKVRAEALSVSPQFVLKES
jgi:hypothetical protein